VSVECLAADAEFVAQVCDDRTFLTKGVLCRIFGIFAALAEFERELIRERTIAGLAAARARGRNGGRKPKMTPAKLRLAHLASAVGYDVVKNT
jgi:DNA invertase Pin-like site-specific DNA recombinase